MKLATITAPEMDYAHEEKGDALHAMETALAMERLNLQVCMITSFTAQRRKTCYECVT